MSKNTSCLGCLGNLVGLAFIGSIFSIFFNGGVLIKAGNFGFSLGNPIDYKQIINNYFSDLESSKKVAEEAVKKFHTQIEQGKCQDIYNQSSEALKKNQSQSEAINSCTELKRQLGRVTSIQLADWWGQPADKDSERYILLRYITVFSKSSAKETFVWVVKGDKAELLNHDLTSFKSGVTPPSPTPSTSPSHSASPDLPIY
jgi:hypothetical protein